MKSSLTRRSFIKRSALAAGTISAVPLFSGPNILAADSPGKKLNCVQIGCGGRSGEHIKWLVTQSKDNLIAIVDPDEKMHAKVKAYLAKNDYDPDKTQVFTDYRKMYDKIGKEIDASSSPRPIIITHPPRAWPFSSAKPFIAKNP